jgi:carboxylate-amine ligase
VARRIGCASELAGVEDILRRGAGYQRMRDAVTADPQGDRRAAVRATLVTD